MFQETPAANPTTKVGQYHEFAEAIREGARVTEQNFSYYFSEDRTSSCALGAAAIAIGKGDDHKFWIAHEIVTHFGIPEQLLIAVAQRNDAGESREDIADWLDTL